MSSDSTKILGRDRNTKWFHHLYHGVYFVPSSFCLGYLAIYLVLLAFPGDWRLFSDPNSPPAEIGLRFFLDYLRTFPIMIFGYLFGALGGVVSTRDLKSYVDLTSIDRNNRILVSGVVGLMASLTAQSGILARLLYGNASEQFQIEPTFLGIIMISFVFGLFAPETILHGRKRFENIVARQGSDAEPEV